MTQQNPKAGADQRRLDPFVGKWKVVGENKGGAPLAADTSVTGDESYEWLPDGFFLVNRWDRTAGDTRHTGMGIIGYDSAKQEYSAHSADNLGFARTYRLREENGTWMMLGDTERATFVFADAGTTMNIHWEISKDGWNWQPLCDLTATKVSS